MIIPHLVTVCPADVQTPRVFARALRASVAVPPGPVLIAPKVTSRLRRCIMLGLVTLLTTTACAGEQPLAPRLATDMVVSAQSVSVGDEVLLWSSAYFPPGSTFDVTVTGPVEEPRPPECPAPYRLHAVKHDGPESGRIGFWSERPLAVGTKLRFVGWSADCGGFYSAYAFQVTAVPGK